MKNLFGLNDRVGNSSVHEKCRQVARDAQVYGILP